MVSLQQSNGVCSKYFVLTNFLIIITCLHIFSYKMWERFPEILCIFYVLYLNGYEGGYYLDLIMNKNWRNAVHRELLSPLYNDIIKPTLLYNIIIWSLTPICSIIHQGPIRKYLITGMYRAPDV